MASCYPLAEWTTLRIEGADRTAWLQNVCTNDIRRLAEGQGCEAFVTDVKGKVLGHIYVLNQAEALLVVSVRGQADPLIAHWDRYIIREDVKLRDVSDQFAWHVLHGPDRHETLDAYLGGDGLLSFERWQQTTGQYEGSPLLVVNSDATIVESCWVAATPDLAASLLKTLNTHDVNRLTDEQFLALRIESCWPLWGVDFDAENLPQEVARNEEAICFTKGCYLGQETVARIDALGHVNRQLAQVRFMGEQVPAPGVELLREGKPAGKITSAAWSDEHSRPLAIAMLRRGSNEAGVELESEVGTGVVQ